MAPESETNRLLSLSQPGVDTVCVMLTYCIMLLWSSTSGCELWIVTTSKSFLAAEVVCKKCAFNAIPLPKIDMSICKQECNLDSGPIAEWPKNI